MRKYFLDNIRWITVVLVVIYHVFYMYNGEGLQGVVGPITNMDIQYFDLYQYIVYPWFMAILFIVSGMCSKYYLDSHTDKEFLKARTTKLLVPSTLGLFTFQFIQGYYNMAIADAFRSLASLPMMAKYVIMVFSGIGVLWYIQILWFESIVLLLIRRFEKDRLWHLGSKANLITMITLVLPVWLSAQILNTPIICVYRFGLYTMLFLLGYFVFSHDEVIDRLQASFLPLTVISIVLGILFCKTYFGQNYAIAPVYKSPLFIAYGYFSCLAILGGMAKYGHWHNRFTRWMNKRSYGLYVFHYLGISVFAYYVGQKGLLSAPLVYALTLLSGLTGGYALNAIISRLPFLKWTVLGIRQEKITSHL